MEIWNKIKTPPKTALKTIQAGRLKGKSDISPQWRYQAMTEVFGSCGFGWKYTIDRVDYQNGHEGQVVCLVYISLYVKHGGEWSDAIPANGGSMLIVNEKQGPHTSDEAVKMATTDALGTAMKMLGMAADVYMGQMDGGKYPTAPLPPTPPQNPTPKPPTPKHKPKLERGTDAWNKATLAVAKGEYTVNEIEARREIINPQDFDLDVADLKNS